MIKVYGIPNCDTMKKARKWLEANGLDYVFHDYKKQGVPEKELRSWIERAGWERLLNRRGTTWRRLDPDIRTDIDEARAAEIMLEHPAIIRRPVLESDKVLLIGFDEKDYLRSLK